jgi:hypothetical protein
MTLTDEQCTRLRDARDAAVDLSQEAPRNHPDRLKLRAIAQAMTDALRACPRRKKEEDNAHS